MGESGQPEDNRWRDVDARQARGMQFGDHNFQYNNFGPVVRSAYLAEVHRIAPADLLDRDAELARLAAFCAGDGPDAYLRWEAARGTGMTALLAWFVLHPPPGVRVVSYFAVAGRSAGETRAAFLDVVLEQLVELTDGFMPGHLTGATGEAHLLSRYTDAAQACERRGERLVLVVDGLDDRRDASRVATLLPDRLVGGLRVVLGTDLGWRAPADLPLRHPLRQRGRPVLLSPFVGPDERARRRAEDARRAEERTRREAEQRRAADDRRAAQEEIGRWRTSEADRTAPAARAAAVRRALVFVGGWTGVLVLVTWLVRGWFDPRVAGILSVQLLAGGLAAAFVLGVAAFRLGGAYGALPASPTAWIDRSRYGLLLRAMAFAMFLVLAGAGAADYLDARDDRHLRQSLGRAGPLPSFEEAVAFLFLVLVTFGCVATGFYLAGRSRRYWHERHREQERAYQAAVGALAAATEREEYARMGADTLSPKAADRARGYQDLMARLAGRDRQRPR
ncbi:hypothetical protein [Micromonospora sp. NPDC005174]|uniref:hypothetical protein n=1 Tax=Micromonospora sp. NPDC005174 TaxID=3157018 RepID=UPI0033A11348